MVIIDDDESNLNRKNIMTLSAKKKYLCPECEIPGKKNDAKKDSSKECLQQK